MRVLYFGTYDKKDGYPRNRLLLEGLRREGVEVVECHRDLWKGNREKLSGARRPSPLLFLRIARAYLGLLWQYLKSGKYDVMVVGYPGHLDIHLAWCLNLLRRKPIVFDAFLSLYQTVVVDRGLVPLTSLRAKLFKALDLSACRAATRVLLDTREHIRYFSRTFGLPEGKFTRVPVGADDSTFLVDDPDERGGEAVENGDGEGRSVLEEMKSVAFPVLFFGTFLPLHGVEVVIQAAHALRKEKDIRFFFVGDGPLWASTLRLARELNPGNLFFHRRWISSTGIARLLRRSAVSLGIFGNGEKSSMVIPCKVYSSLAAGCPVITADTPAAREFLTNGKDAVLIPPGDPGILAETLYRLKCNSRLLETVGREGKNLYKSKFLPQHLAGNLLTSLTRERSTFSPPKAPKEEKINRGGEMVMAGKKTRDGGP